MSTSATSESTSGIPWGILYTSRTTSDVISRGSKPVRIKSLPGSHRSPERAIQASFLSLTAGGTERLDTYPWRQPKYPILTVCKAVRLTNKQTDEQTDKRGRCGKRWVRKAGGWKVRRQKRQVPTLGSGFSSVRLLTKQRAQLELPS